MPTVAGPFEVTRHAEPPYHVADGITLGRSRFDKVFHGALAAQSQVEMLAAVTAVAGSAAYVAIERVVGTLDGRAGTFILCHTGTMTRGTPGLVVTVVPDSGTGALVGLTGAMQIDIVDGKHAYTFTYALTP
ncbi:MAG: DUF3224 domain-containing protein [Kofleriaceae bacterium]